MIPASLTNAYAPSRVACFNAYRELLDEDTVRGISYADYGRDADRHFEALIPIWKEGVVPYPLEWEPREVLELTRWDEPDSNPSRTDAQRRRGHIDRGFCCAALLLAASNPEDVGFLQGENQTLAQLVDSSLRLGPPFPACLGSFLVWRLAILFEPYGDSDTDGKIDILCYALSLLFMLALDPGCALRERDLEESCRWLQDEQAALPREARKDLAFKPDLSQRWLVGQTTYNLREYRWREIAGRVAESGASPSVKNLAELILHQ